MGKVLTPRWVIGTSMKRIRVDSKQRLLDRTKGFTLIEILVVIIIIMVITMVALLTFSYLNRSQRVLLVAEGLVKTINAAQQEAILCPMVLRLKFTSSGYIFLQLKDKDNETRNVKWVALSHDKLSQPNAFKSGIKVSVKKPNLKKEYLVFSPTGEVSPFILVISNKASSKVYRLQVYSNGTVRLQRR